MTFPAKHISIGISSSKEAVYEFASNPANFPKWLAFVKTVEQASEQLWSAATDAGNITIEMSPKNEFGVIDHIVHLPDGASIVNPLRVIGNNEGAEIIFTLFQLPGRTAGELEQDAKLVSADLETLKEILEVPA